MGSYDEHPSKEECPGMVQARLVIAGVRKYNMDIQRQFMYPDCGAQFLQSSSVTHVCITFQTVTAGHCGLPTVSHGADKKRRSGCPLFAEARSHRRRLQGFDDVHGCQDRSPGGDPHTRRQMTDPVRSFRSEVRACEGPRAKIAEGEFKPYMTRGRKDVRYERGLTGRFSSHVVSLYRNLIN